MEEWKMVVLLYVFYIIFLVALFMHLSPSKLL